MSPPNKAVLGWRTYIAVVQHNFKQLRLAAKRPNTIENYYRTYRQTKITALRLYHQLKTAHYAYNRSSTACNCKNYLRLSRSLTLALTNKYAATFLAIIQHTTANKIPLEDWFLAQFSLLGRKVKFFTPFVCYGPNAQIRYEQWVEKHKRTYLRLSDRQHAYVSTYKAIHRAIRKSHLQALLWQHSANIKELEFPNLSAVLLFLWPQTVSVWYIIAYQEFRDLVCKTGFIQDTRLQDCYKKWKRSPRIKKICEEALEMAIHEDGSLEW